MTNCKIIVLKTENDEELNGKFSHVSVQVLEVHPIINGEMRPAQPPIGAEDVESAQLTLHELSAVGRVAWSSRSLNLLLPVEDGRKLPGGLPETASARWTSCCRIPIAPTGFVLWREKRIYKYQARMSILGQRSSV